MGLGIDPKNDYAFKCVFGSECPSEKAFGACKCVRKSENVPRRIKHVRARSWHYVQNTTLAHLKLRGT